MSMRIRDFVPSYRARGRSPEFGTFGEFMVSRQIRKPTERGARDIISLAKAMVPPSSDERNGHYSESFLLLSGKLTTIVKGRHPNPRVLVKVVNTHASAPAIEFGSGPKAEGTGGPGPREQGGFNKAKRPLGRAGRRIGRSG
ncbi:MAG: hypothetical protein M3Q39_10010 [Actinomycetota bacterium]|nr:hypothetical protein [Actinomycetota bacterium]